MGEVAETRLMFDERERDRAGRAVAVLCDDELGLT